MLSILPQKSYNFCRRDHIQVFGAHFNFQNLQKEGGGSLPLQA